MQNIFSVVLQPGAMDALPRMQKVENPPSKEEIVSSLLATEKHLLALGKPVTLASVREAIQMPLSRLYSYAQVKTVLRQIIARSYRVYKKRGKISADELLIKAERAVEYLKSINKPITYCAVGEIIGLRPENFKSYPTINDFIENQRSASQ